MTQPTATLLHNLIDACHATIEAHAGELTALDQAIGDGDHGINMKRGFNAVVEARGEIEPLGFGEALKKAGMTLVMKVGGASGPLYGSLLMAMGKAAKEQPPANAEEIATLLAAGIEAVKARGKSDTGAKTMLDVLVPVLDTLHHDDKISSIRDSADAALAATKDMLATKGRAAFLGERSVGHLDPGARSSTLLIHAICDIVEGK